MRFTSLITLSAAPLFFNQPLAAATTVDMDDDDDLDFDDDDDDFDLDLEPSAESDEGTEVKEDTTLAEAADAGLSPVQRSVRMAACIGMVRHRISTKKEEVDKVIDQWKLMRQMTDEQAMDILHVTMLKNCYINLDQEADIKSFTSDPEEFQSDIADRVFSPPAGEAPGTQATLLQRQWDLVKDYIETESKFDEARQMPKIDLPGSSFGPFMKTIYFNTVFSAVFGGIYVMIQRLTKGQEQLKKKKTGGVKKHQE